MCELNSCTFNFYNDNRGILSRTISAWKCIAQFGTDGYEAIAISRKSSVNNVRWISALASSVSLRKIRR